MVTNRFKLKAITFGLAASLCAISGSAYASAFNLWEYNGVAIGNYNAGGAAIAEDASTGFTNPAGLVRLPHAQIVISGDPVLTKSSFKGYACGGLVGPVTTSTGAVISNACLLSRVRSDDGGGFGFVPATHVSLPITDRWFAGLSLTGPFGLKTDYGRTKPVKYSATKSEIFSININPNVAFKINDHWSVGAGFDALWLDAVLDQSINLFPQNVTLTPLVPPIPFTVNSTMDSQAENHADDWGYGWNAGVLWQRDENTRVGLSYRSHIVVKPSGTSKLNGPGAVSLRTTRAKTTIDLPGLAMLSGYYKFNPQWAAMATVSYTQWSSIQKIVLKNTVTPNPTAPFTVLSGPGQPVPAASFTMQINPAINNVTLPQKFRNTWRASAGIDYMPTEKWRVRMGGGFDQTPIKTKHRTVRLPDANRWALAIGGGYTINEYMRVDAGYEHIWQGDGKINQANSISMTQGKVHNSGDVLGFQGTLTFV